jgi:hypothetical protein
LMLIPLLACSLPCACSRDSAFEELLCEDIIFGLACLEWEEYDGGCTM